MRAFTGHSQTGWYLEGAKEEEPNLRNLRRLLLVFCAILIGRGCANVDGVALEVQPRICPHQKGKLEIDFYIWIHFDVVWPLKYSTTTHGRCRCSVEIDMRVIVAIVYVIAFGIFANMVERTSLWRSVTVICVQVVQQYASASFFSPRQQQWIPPFPSLSFC